MLRRLALLSALVTAALVLAPAALSAGGHYAFAGGTPAEQSQVAQALQASSFPWNVVPQTIVVHIAPGLASDATPGNLWLDANLLDAGRFSWGVVQHEFAHQVDFLVLTDAQRTSLHALLGGASWWGDGTLAHSALDGERFADEVAWSYWPSPDNVMRPDGTQDEGGQVAPAAFRAALASLLPGLVPVRTTAAASSPNRR
jgi:hypothetical protein